MALQSERQWETKKRNQVKLKFKTEEKHALLSVDKKARKSEQDKEGLWGKSARILETRRQEK
jgi:hypothetical protein